MLQLKEHFAEHFCVHFASKMFKQNVSKMLQLLLKIDAYRKRAKCNQKLKFFFYGGEATIFLGKHRGCAAIAGGHACEARLRVARLRVARLRVARLRVAP